MDENILIPDSTPRPEVEDVVVQPPDDIIIDEQPSESTVSDQPVDIDLIPTAVKANDEKENPFLC